MEYPYRGTSEYVAPPKKMWPKDAELKRLSSWIEKVEGRNRARIENILFLFLILIPQACLIPSLFISEPNREIVCATLTIWSALGLLPFFGIMHHWDRQESQLWDSKKKAEKLIYEKAKFYEEI